MKQERISTSSDKIVGLFNDRKTNVTPVIVIRITFVLYDNIVYSCNSHREGYQMYLNKN